MAPLVESTATWWELHDESNDQLSARWCHEHQMISPSLVTATNNQWIHYWTDRFIYIQHPAEGKSPPPLPPSLPPSLPPPTASWSADFLAKWTRTKRHRSIQHQENQPDETDWWKLSIQHSSSYFI